MHSFPEAEDDEKTTIESGWEDEASTTIEQGEVQDRIRQAVEPRINPITGITSTNAGADELTVDDREGKANLPLQPPPPIANVARLLVTAGNDTGQELEIRPGKSFTIGRAIDNDLVLTDIAVSRKHFDLVFEHDGWVVMDRGSGNGTVVNGNIEDQPFVLANGDLIEIGNTVFRFEAPNLTPPPRAPAQAFDVDVDEEPSTVAGRQPPRAEVPAPLARAAAAPLPSLGTPGPTAPLPVPRVRPKTQPPPPPTRARTNSAVPATYPLATPSANPVPGPHVHRGPMSSPPPPMGMPLAASPTQPPAIASPPPMMANQQQMLHQLVASHANVRPMSPAPGYAPYGYPGVGDLSGSHPATRDATSTALVPPTPYNGLPLSSPPTQTGFGIPISRRTKLIAAGIGVALLASVITVAIVKGGDRPPIDVPVAETKAEPDVKPIVAPAAKVEAKVEPKIEAKVEPKPEPKPEPKIEAKVEPKPEPKQIEPKPEPKKVEPRPEPKPEPKKIEAKVEPKPEPKKVEPKPEPKVEPKPKTVAVREPTTSGRADLSPIKSKAADQFRAKNFAAAAATLRGAAGSASASDAKELKALASTYEQFGRAYNTGMAPGTKPPEAYQALKTAKNFDSDGAFQPELKAKIGEVAAKAAGLYIVRSEYEAAYAALADAEAYGGSNSNTQFIRKNLEAKANDLYNQAAKEMGSDPDDAKAKLTTVTKMVSRTSPLYTKAKKLLGS